MLVLPPNTIYLTLQELCFCLLSAAPIHQNALPVGGDRSTIVALLIVRMWNCDYQPNLHVCKSLEVINFALTHSILWDPANLIVIFPFQEIDAPLQREHTFQAPHPQFGASVGEAPSIHHSSCSWLCWSDVSVVVECENDWPIDPVHSCCIK